eukprot:79158-Prorocentrum_minimum.AAC.1
MMMPPDPTSRGHLTGVAPRLHEEGNYTCAPSLGSAQQLNRPFSTSNSFVIQAPASVIRTHTHTPRRRRRPILHIPHSPPRSRLPPPPRGNHTQKATHVPHTLNTQYILLRFTTLCFRPAVAELPTALPPLAPASLPPARVVHRRQRCRRLRTPSGRSDGAAASENAAESIRRSRAAACLESRLPPFLRSPQYRLNKTLKFTPPKAASTRRRRSDTKT